MACTNVACIGDGGCVEPVPAGTVGQVMTQTPAGPAWATSTGSLFECSDLASCSIDALGDVASAGAANGAVLTWDGANWVPVVALPFALTTVPGTLATFATPTLNVPNPLPIADIAVTSEVGLLGSVTGRASGGTQDGNPLTFAWAATTLIGTGTLALTSPAAETTAFQATEPGQYQILLTVTDGNGNTETAEQVIALDRVLYVGGTHIDRFDTLQSAFAWITANDAANDALYLIEVTGRPADTARVAATLASVHLNNGALLSVGVDFTLAGQHRWSGEGGRNSRIVSAAGPALAGVAGVTLFISGLGVTSTDAAAPGAVSFVSGTFEAYDSFITGNGTNAMSLVGTGGLTQDTRFSGRSVLGPGGFFAFMGGQQQGNGGNESVQATNTTLTMVGVNTNTLLGAPVLVLTNVRGSLTGCKFNVTGTSATFANPGVIIVNTPGTAAQRLSINSCELTNEGIGSDGNRCALKLLPGGAGILRIVSNELFSTDNGLHVLGVPTGQIRIEGNAIRGANDGVLSSTDEAGAVALPYLLAPFYGNVIEGAITNVTFAVGTPLPGGNIQV